MSAALTPVAIQTTAGPYPADFPFHPDSAYPEYRGAAVSAAPNPVYAAVRGLLFQLGYDRAAFGTPAWNPLGALVQPGDRVCLKPNLVSPQHRAGGDPFSVITHPSVLRALADYVALALQGRGEIVIADNPSIDADWDALMRLTRLNELEPYYAAQGVTCRVLDLRPRWTPDLTTYGFRSGTVERAGDPAGSTVINLGRASYFAGQNPLLFRGVFTKRWETIRHHHGATQEYCLSNTILHADVFISVPKLKTHHKVGVTLNAKGLVGINANKNYLVHWKIGTPALGGDEFRNPALPADYALLALRHLLLDWLPERAFLAARRRWHGSRLGVLFEDTRGLSFQHQRGAWAGNDTCWRMAADLYNLFVRDLPGWRRAAGRPPQRFLSVVDGVTAGQGNGPFTPTAKAAQVLVGGADLLLVDAVAARLMGFNVAAIAHLAELLAAGWVDPADIPVTLDGRPQPDFFAAPTAYLDFVPPDGWGHLLAARLPEQELVA